MKLRRSSLAFLTLFFLASLCRADVIPKVCLLQGGQSVPPVTTTAEGYGRFTIDTDANTLTFEVGVVGLSGAETQAALHGPAGPGTTGPVLFQLPLGRHKNGTWAYPESVEADLLAGNVYLSVESAGFPAGEVRGQVCDMVCEARGFFVIPSNASTGYAWGVFNVDRVAKVVSYHIVIDTLEGVETQSHLRGMTDHAAGGLYIDTLPSGSPKVGTWNYSDYPERDVLLGRMYLSVQSDVYLEELRGQITPLLMPLVEDEAVPPSGSTGYGFALMSWAYTHNRLGWHIRTRELSSPVTSLEVRGYAPEGEGGNVAQQIVGAHDELRGAWAYSGETPESAIETGLMYIQANTANHPSGELRGQVLLEPEPLPHVGVPSCFGVACPCGNDDPAGGCLNSSGRGARLDALGSASVSEDDLLLRAFYLPAFNSGLFYMGDQVVSSAFFDGLQCALGQTWRFQCCIQSSGPGGGIFLGPGIAAEVPHLIQAGTTWHFHGWFRDVPGTPCGSGANLTNLLSITFTP